MVTGLSKSPSVWDAQEREKFIHHLKFPLSLKKLEQHICTLQLAPSIKVRKFSLSQASRKVL